MTKLYLFILLLFATINLSAERNCGTMDVLESLINKDPTTIDKLEDQELQTQNSFPNRQKYLK